MTTFSANWSWPTAATFQDRDIACEDVLVTPPLIEPLDLDEVKKQRRFSSTTLDTRFDVWISAARQQFEEESNLQLITATRMFLMDGFPIQPLITVNRSPVQQIVSVEYLDDSGTVQTMDAADYELFPPLPTKGVYASPSGVHLVGDASWPSAASRAGAVRVTYIAGFGDAPGDVPELIAYALMQYVGDFHRWSENMTERPANVTAHGSVMVRRNASMFMWNARRMTRW
jgi:uncharacterized phiE125 gp8 family phage protein